MSAAIFYVPQAYSTGDPKVMGRHAAGESFLRAYFTHGNADEFWVRVKDQAHIQSFADTAHQYGRSEPVYAVNAASLANLARPGLLYYPGPELGASAWQRASTGGHASWSLCGVTHTTCSAAAMDALANLLVAPVQPWDAVICTSAAVKHNVQRLLQAQADYLKERFGASRLVTPELPLIPLGIHARDFVHDAAQRKRARKFLQVDANTVVVLFLGRLSFHAKAHPLAMYQALEQAALQTGKKVVLVEYGWHASDGIATAYAEAAELACPSIRVVKMLDSNNPESRRTALAGADVFCSLADNFQETFGLTPIEAMAAGLPVVVSDWDGYKDTVRHGVDGFRIPTTMPPAGLGADIAQRHALGSDSYDTYCGHTSSLVAVDVEATVECFARLFSSAELRRQLGAAGQQRARDVYDWANIIPRYETLWSELAAIRTAARTGANTRATPWPARLDPFHAFAVYPSQTLDPDTLIELVDPDLATALARLARYRNLAMVNYANAILPDEAETSSVLQALADGARQAADLVTEIPLSRRSTVFRGLVWLAKMNVVRIRHPS